MARPFFSIFLGSVGLFRLFYHHSSYRSYAHFHIMTAPAQSNFGKWMALTAALLGWLFDGLEMGLFPLVARPALQELGVSPDQVLHWNGIITALFLVGAATGGVLFGWL